MITKTLCKLLGVILILTVVVVAAAHAGKPVPGKGGVVYKVATNDVYKTVLINNIFNYYSNNGDGSFNPFSADNEGFEFGKGSSGFIIFEDGVVWGCFQNGVKKVGGSTYNHGLQAGKILSPGVADNPGLAKYRVFRVRPDVNPSIPFDAEMEKKLQNEEVAYLGRYEAFSAREIYDEYVLDWNE